MSESNSLYDKKICDDCNCAYYGECCPLCGKDENGKKFYTQQGRSKKGGRKSSIIFILLILLVVFGYIKRDEITTLISKSNESSLVIRHGEQYNKSDLNKKEEIFPDNGTVNFYTDDEQIGMIQVINKIDKYMYVKFKNESGTKTAISAYVHPLSTIDIPVPLGRYKPFYALGNKWYGESDLFGIDTVYGKGDNILDIKIEDNIIKGISFTVYNTTVYSDFEPRSNKEEFLD